MTRDENDLVNVSYENAVRFGKSDIPHELANMFTEYDDITITGTEVDTVNGCRYIIMQVFNNISRTYLTKKEIGSAYYHAFAPSTIII